MCFVFTQTIPELLGPLYELDFVWFFVSPACITEVLSNEHNNLNSIRICMRVLGSERVVADGYIDAKTILNIFI